MIHFENEKFPLKQKTNVTAGYSGSISKKLCKVLENTVPILWLQKVNLPEVEQLVKPSYGRPGNWNSWIPKLCYFHPQILFQYICGS